MRLGLTISGYGIRFARSEDGNVFALFAFALIALLTSIGLAVDGSRGFTVRSELRNALDAAGLAMAREYETQLLAFTGSDGSVDQTGLERWAADFMNEYLAANFNEGFFSSSTVTSDTTVVTLSSNASNPGRIDIQATTSMPTYLLGLVQIDTITVAVSGSYTVGSDRGLVEVALVIDNSASNNWSGTEAELRNSVNEFVNAIFPNECARNNTTDALETFGDGCNIAESRISVVPFNQGVSLFDNRSNQEGSYANMNSRNYINDWGFFDRNDNSTSRSSAFGDIGCVDARYTDIDDDGVATGAYLLLDDPVARTTYAPTANQIQGNGIHDLFDLIYNDSNAAINDPIYAIRQPDSEGYTISSSDPNRIVTQAQGMNAFDPNYQRQCRQVRQGSSAAALTDDVCHPYFDDYIPSGDTTLWFDLRSGNGADNLASLRYYSATHMDDTPPAGPDGVGFYAYGDAPTSDGYGYSGATNCAQPIIPLTNRREAIDQLLHNWRPRGATRMDKGLAWGWRTLSTAWQDYWGDGDANDGVADNTGYPLVGSRKVMVFITDGFESPFGQEIAEACPSYVNDDPDNTIERTRCSQPGREMDGDDIPGIGSTPYNSSFSATTNAHRRSTLRHWYRHHAYVALMCDQIRAEGIDLYVIYLESERVDRDHQMSFRPTYQACARETGIEVTSSTTEADVALHRFFIVPNGQALGVVLSGIGQNVSPLRISQ